VQQCITECDCQICIYFIKYVLNIRKILTTQSIQTRTNKNYTTFSVYQNNYSQTYNTNLYSNKKINVWFLFTICYLKHVEFFFIRLSCCHNFYFNKETSIVTQCMRFLYWLLNKLLSPHYSIEIILIDYKYIPGPCYRWKISMQYRHSIEFSLFSLPNLIGILYSYDKLSK